MSTNRERTLMEVREAVLGALAYYGPVKRASRNRYQSARIATNFRTTLGKEFTLITVQISDNHPHRVSVVSAVFAEDQGQGKFFQRGSAPTIEKTILSTIGRRLGDLEPGAP